MTLKFEYQDPHFSSCEIGERPVGEVQFPPPITDYENSDFRRERLLTAWGQACATVALMSHRYQRAWLGAVTSMHDHKGILEVTWRDQQSREIFEGVLVGAWERVGEHAHAHRVASGR
jgi:hypothetical protein